MKMNMIVAIARNGGIGFKNKIPWKLGADLKYFKEKTIGSGNNAVVMGKKTWQSLPHTSKFGNFLPKRDNIILSKNTQIKWTKDTKGVNNCFILSSIDEMKKHCKERNYDEVWIIGGETIYKQFILDLDLHNIYVTEIDNIYEADTYFPTIPDNFSLFKCSQPLQDNGISYVHKIFKRNRFQVFPRYGGMLHSPVWAE